MSDEYIQFDTGTLSTDEVRAILGHLHLDITLVDAQDRVRYYSEGFRVFRRAPENLGTNVLECHSPSTRPRVAQLMSELRSGWRDDAEFLVQNDGRNVEVRYIALRDEAGEYQGVLEIARYLDGDPPT